MYEMRKNVHFVQTEESEKEFAFSSPWLKKKVLQQTVHFCFQLG